MQKVIQFKKKIEGITGWEDTDEINLEFEGKKIIHRIKTEQKYRPFKSVEECWEEMQKHQPFGWIKPITTRNFLNLVDINLNTNFKLYFITYTFADSSPFGIKEE